MTVTQQTTTDGQRVTDQLGMLPVMTRLYQKALTQLMMGLLTTQ